MAKNLQDSGKTEGQTEGYEREAFELGVEAAKAAASWATDGNVPVEHFRRLRAMMEDGDPADAFYLPATPNLSGEWAGDATPLSLARDVLGEDDPDPELVDLLADAWERGVDETFRDECERLVREAAS